jgi:hypothetical protein
MAAVDGQIGGNAMLIIFDYDAQPLQWFDHFNPDWANMRIHALHVQMPRRMQIKLLIADPHRKTGIHDVQMWINAKGRSEEKFAVGSVAIEEIAIIKIAVGARKGNRIGRLMDWEVIAFGQH